MLHATLAWMLLVSSVLTQFGTVSQMETQAVRAEVEPQEGVRYQEYDKRHGAKHTAAGVADVDEDAGWQSQPGALCHEVQHL